MKILAIDTTSEFGSLAVRADGELLAELHVQSSDGFAHLLFPAIEQVLKQAHVTLRDIDCFAGAAGPGAFTGVRVGLSAVKGLADANGKAAVGVSNLRAASLFGTEDRRAVVLDARRGEVFAAVYEEGGAMIRPEIVTKLSTWLAEIADADYQFVAPASFRDSLPPFRFVALPSYLADAVARCAEVDGVWGDPAALDANYVRRSDAELLWRDR